MGALMREINLRRRPHFLLSLMMNALEKKRQAKRLGWSRPWNKDGVTVFRTHRHFLDPDAAFMDSWKRGFWEACPDMPEAYRGFAEDLWNDPARMAFTFYHNRSEGGREFEGLTLSLGRKVRTDPTKRDRIDIILEDLRIGGSVDNLLDSARIIVNPFQEWSRGEAWAKDAGTAPEENRLQQLYAEAIGFYRRHREDSGRQWDHWAVRYIDYFGPRAFIPRGSAFT